MEDGALYKGKTIQELLKKATEEEYFLPVLEERHEQALEFLKTIGIAKHAFSSTSGYYNRKESALAPALEWTVGLSTLRVNVLLITEILEEDEFDNKWENLGLDGLKNAEPLVRAIEQAFREFSRGIDLDLLEKFDSEYENSPRPLPFYINYVKLINTDKGFLRVWVFGTDKRVIMPETNVEKIITTHLRFYKNEFPRPHGTGKDSIAL